MHGQGQRHEDEQAVTEVIADADLLLARGETGGQQQGDGNEREPAEMAVGQGQAVAEGEEDKQSPWQRKHLKSLLLRFCERLRPLREICWLAVVTRL